MDTKKASELVKSVGCCHSVCWKCYGMAFKSGHPILNCPMCRCTFTEHTVEDSSDDDLGDVFTDESDGEVDDEDFIRLLENSDVPQHEHEVAINIMSAVNQAAAAQDDISFILENSILTQTEQNMNDQIAVNIANGSIRI